MAANHQEEVDGARWEAVEEIAEMIQEGQHEQALFLLRDVAKAEAKNPYVYYFMGVALYELDKLEAARDAFRAAVKLAPRYVGARGSLAQVLRRLRDYRGAIVEAKATLLVRNDDPDALHALGLAYAAQGQRVEAQRHLEAFLRTHPEFEAAQEAQGVLELLRHGQGPVEID